jgi:sulfite reductase (NADPH) flavoprotein alpha-component
MTMLNKGKSRYAGSVFIAGCLLLALLLGSGAARAEKRHPDPDGCFSCHGLPDLKYLDKQNQLRSATILKSDYYGSLHGSVPCKDCHRKISDYPHEEKDGLVDCGDSCHVKEPSEGKAFTHKKIVAEYEKSVHGKGWSKKFAAGNRAEEDQASSLPSCRRCHANDPYIADNQWAAFKDAFAHNDAECGTCHQGDVWRDQFSGHILRRYIGNRLNKTQANKICVDCHGDIEKMAKVEQEDSKTKQKKPVSPAFIHSVETYDKMLHGRLLADGNPAGPSCLECHAPAGLHHAIFNNDDPAASVHPNHLTETCGQGGCHQGYAKNPLNNGFLTMPMHDVAMIGLGLKASVEQLLSGHGGHSGWYLAAALLGSAALVFVLGSFYWQWRGDRSKLGKNTNNSILGAQKFQELVIGSKPKTKAKSPHWQMLTQHLPRLLAYGYRKYIALQLKRIDRMRRRRALRKHDGR